MTLFWVDGCAFFLGGLHVFTEQWIFILFSIIFHAYST